MSTTQAQWYSKLKSFVPAWYFENEVVSKAFFEALAKLLAEMQNRVEQEILVQTFIDQSSDAYLDLHGDERSTPRLTAELDGSYKIRVRSLSNKVNKPDLKSIVDDLLLVGEATILEDFNGGAFFNREYAMNRDMLIIEALRNTFTVLFDNQRPQPFAFLNRENFLDRDAYSISLFTPTAFFSAIVQAIADNKALGTLYRVIERVET